jgi:hypothetical protein
MELRFAPIVDRRDLDDEAIASRLASRGSGLSQPPVEQRAPPLARPPVARLRNHRRRLSLHVFTDPASRLADCRLQRLDHRLLPLPAR